MEFFLKKLVAPLFNPLTLAAICALIALLHRRRPRLWIALCLLVLLLFGYPKLPSVLRRTLVSRYPLTTTVTPGVTNIVVLGGGGFTMRDAPIDSRLHSAYLHRIVGGVRLHREIPNSRIFMLVGRPEDPEEVRRALDELATLLGVEAETLVPVLGGRDTRAEARLMRDILGTNRFYVATSELHMPRAIMLFKQAGLDPIPAPMDTFGRGDAERPFTPDLMYPKAETIAMTDEVIHEYLGIAWGWGRGKLKR